MNKKQNEYEEYERDSCEHYDVYENGATNEISCPHCGKIFQEGHNNP